MIHTIQEYIRKNKLNVYQIAVQTDAGIHCARCQPCNDCGNIFSVTKVFLNTAAGMLMDEGKLKLDDPILPIIQPFVDFPYDPVWNDVTIRHALSHRMGVDAGVIDIDRDDIRTYQTDNHLKYILDYPPKFRPGSYRKYTDGAHYLLSLAVEQLVQMPADTFIRQKLLKPLDFQHTAWTRCPRNHTIGATGAYMRTDDMVKIGWLYLNRGAYNGQQIVTEDWIAAAEQGRFDFYPIKNSSFWQKGGMNGQMLLYSRKKRIAVAWEACEAYTKIQQFTDEIVGLAEEK